MFTEPSYSEIGIENQKVRESKHECTHCGLPCYGKPIQQENLFFCCSGCAAVYNLLNESNMCRYYAEGNGLVPEIKEDGELGFLNDEETASKFIVFQDGESIQYKFIIPGMHCNSCIYLLERLDKLNENIISSRVDFFKKEILVNVKSSNAILSSVVGLLFKLGYKPDLTLSNNTKKNKTVFSVRSIKIGIAGFCFGNIMMLSFPEYLGLSLDSSSLGLKRSFDYISLILSLPVLLYCASEFFESSWKAIKNRTLTIDLPIALAILATFIRSLYELFVLKQTAYFDSMTGIVFLLLIGRYFQDLSYNSLSFDRDYRSYFPLSARQIVKGHPISVNIGKLKKGDKIELRNSELLPADAILDSGTALLDYSFITGESSPSLIEKGNKVYAGAIVNGNSAQFTLLGSTDNSRLVKLWSIEKNKSKEDTSLTENLNFYFTLGLLVVSAFAFIYQFQHNGVNEAIKALSSVLIVACPCILLLATTFSNGHVLRSLKKNGMFVKNKNTISQLANCDVIIFDKTGTLTNNKAFEISNHTTLNGEELEKFAFLCQQSLHPYSVAIASTYYKHKDYKLNAYSDIAGNGLVARIGNDLLRLGSSSFIGKDSETYTDDISSIHLELNGTYKGCFILKHNIRPETNAILKGLNSAGYELYLSSGDVRLNTEIDQSMFKGTFIKQQPEDKVKLVKSLQANGKIVCMAGDGLNDAPAMKEANLAIAVADNENSFFPASDVLLTSDALRKLPNLFKFIKSSKWIIIIAFAFSLIYNIIGLWYAVNAQLSPLTAAILMPCSSLSMLLITWFINRYLTNRIIPIQSK